MSYETISYEKRDHVGVVTLDRPDALNAFNRRMEAELSGLWTEMRNDDDVWVAVLTAAGDRAFCVGVDTKESTAEVSAMSQFERWKKVPGSTVTARQNGCFKPVITAVNGMCGGGGLYFVADSDIVIAAENATFFDPHVTYGRVAAVEPIALTRRMPFGEVMRTAELSGLPTLLVLNPLGEVSYIAIGVTGVSVVRGAIEEARAASSG